MTLSGAEATSSDVRQRIFCPALRQLTAEQADLAFVMPRLDHNRAIRESRGQGQWAALLASDPFGSETTLFADLYDIGFRGITNWPSSILLDGSLRQSMSTIPASPDFEYRFLARAKAAGFETKAFVLSLDQAKSAIGHGLRHLILHPGVLDVDGAESSAMVQRSLQRLIDAIKSAATDVSVSIYTSPWHERQVPLSALNVDGVIWLEAET
jgi:predicted TIM-barrel enzyme